MKKYVYICCSQCILKNNHGYNLDIKRIFVFDICILREKNGKTEKEKEEKNEKRKK